MYGFVSVPSQYVHYEIRVPVFEDIVKNVKLTDISYELQNVLKKQFGKLNAEMKGSGIEEVVINGLPVSDAHILFQMMTNYECNLLDDVSFYKLSSLFSVLEGSSYSKKLTPLETANISEETEMKTTVVTNNELQDDGNKRPAWINSLVGKINQSREKFNALIME